MPARLRLPPEREDQILATTHQLITELGFEKVTVDAVAARSGTSKATLYRRWPSKAELLVAAVRRGVSTNFEVPTHATFRDDVLAALRLAAHWSSVNRSMLQSLADAGSRDARLADEFQRQIAHPHDTMWTTVLARWRGQPDIRDDIDLQWVHDLSESILFTQLVPTAPPLSDDYLVRFVDEILVPLFTR